jgi:chromosome segregation ATPase
MTANQQLNRKLKKLILRDFQLHTHTEIDVVDGLNIFVGSSDVGKTAINRALSWALFNESIDSDIVQHNKKHCEVEIHFQDDSVIIRKKGKKINTVEFKYPDDEGFELVKNFGDKYPEQVVQFLGNPPKSEKLGNIPYSKQSKKLFIIDESPMHLPGILADLVGVSDIEEAAKKTSAESKNLDKTIKATEREITALEKEIEQKFVGLDDKLSNLKKLNKELEDIDLYHNTLDCYDGFLMRKENIDIQGNKANNIKKKNQKILDAIEKKVADIEVDQSSVKIFDSFLVKQRSINKKISEAEKSIRINTKIYNLLTNKINDINSYNEALDAYENFLDTKEDLDNKINVCESQLENIKNQLSSSKIELDNYIQKLKEENKFCEQCRQVGGFIV